MVGLSAPIRNAQHAGRRAHPNRDCRNGRQWDSTGERSSTESSARGRSLALASPARAHRNPSRRQGAEFSPRGAGRGWTCGYCVDFVPGDWRSGVDPAVVKAALAADRDHAISPKALAAAKTARCPRAYWDWAPMLQDNLNGFFPYTPATNLA